MWQTRPLDALHLSADQVRQDSAPPDVRRSGLTAPPHTYLEAWLAAVERLHAAGLPVPALEFGAAWLRRRGVRTDWQYAA
jgi:hypothetical protein